MPQTLEEIMTDLITLLNDDNTTITEDMAKIHEEITNQALELSKQLRTTASPRYKINKLITQLGDLHSRIRQVEMNLRDEANKLSR